MPVQTSFQIDIEIYEDKLCQPGNSILSSHTKCILVPVDCFTIVNSADPGEMSHSVAIHMGLHCLLYNKF